MEFILEFVKIYLVFIFLLFLFRLILWQFGLFLVVFHGQYTNLSGDIFLINLLLFTHGGIFEVMLHLDLLLFIDKYQFI